MRKAPVTYNAENALYERGIFLEKEYGLPPNGPLSLDLVQCIQRFSKEKFLVMPRVLYYPQTVQYLGGVKTRLSSQRGYIYVEAIMGISSAESKILLQKAGSIAVRSFTETDYDVCLLTSTQAKALNTSIGDRVSLAGREMVVLGILSEEVLSQIMDLDGFKVSAPNPMYTPQLAKDLVFPQEAQALQVIKLESKRIAFVPAKLSLDMGGYVASINIIPRSEEILTSDLEELANNLTFSLDLNLWLKDGPNVYSVTRIQDYFMLGYEVIMILVVIAALNMAASVMGNVRERMREIGTLSMVGLSPAGSMSMVFMESIIYILIGSLFGYFSGYIINTFLTYLGLLPRYFPFNYASMSILFSMLLVFGTMMVTSIFPARLAAKMVTPSLKRRWEFPTQPKGDRWEIPLPFRINTQKEALGILYFLKEYFAMGGKEGRMYVINRVEDVLDEELKLEMDVQHAPFEGGLTSHVVVQAQPEEKDYVFHIYLKMTTGIKHMWVSSSYYFVDVLRKQYILWRSLPPMERDKYTREIGRSD